jgi:hypothetical protein
VSSGRYDVIDTWKKQGRSAVLLWLLTMNLGTALGAGLYESRVVVSDWPKMPPSEWPNTGVEFWAYVTTVPLTTLTILNAVAAWRDRSPRRRSWLASVGITACERLATFGYFIPTMVGLMGRPTLDPVCSPIHPCHREGEPGRPRGVSGGPEVMPQGYRQRPSR